MTNSSHARIVTFLLFSVIFSLECSTSRRPTLQIKSRHHAPVTFHLLNVDPIAFVMGGGDEKTPRGSEVYRVHPRLKVLAGKLDARRFGGYSLSPDVFLFMDQSRPLWEHHVIKSGETDTTGDARLDNLTPGSYWLLAYSDSQGAEAFWIQQVDIKDGNSEVELQPGNALYKSSIE